MTILKTFVTPGKTVEEVQAWFVANPGMAPDPADRPARIAVIRKTIDGNSVVTEEWDCTEEEYDSNNWGEIPEKVATELGMYTSTDHLTV